MEDWWYSVLPWLKENIVTTYHLLWKTNTFPGCKVRGSTTSRLMCNDGAKYLHSERHNTVKGALSNRVDCLRLRAERGGITGGAQVAQALTADCIIYLFATNIWPEHTHRSFKTRIYIVSRQRGNSFTVQHTLGDRRLEIKDSRWSISSNLNAVLTGQPLMLRRNLWFKTHHFTHLHMRLHCLYTCVYLFTCATQNSWKEIKLFHQIKVEDCVSTSPCDTRGAALWYVAGKLEEPAGPGGHGQDRVYHSMFVHFQMEHKSPEKYRHC